MDDNTEVSFITMSDVSETGDINNENIRIFKEVKKGYTIFENGDVLFAKITPCMENGKGALAIDLKNGIGCGSTEFHVLRPLPELVLGKWLYYYTVFPDFRKTAEIKMTGSAGQKRVPKSFFDTIDLFLPSIHEQEKQISILHSINNIIIKRNHEIQILDELIKSRFVEMFGDIEQNCNHYSSYLLSDLCTISSSKRIYQSEQTTVGVPFVRVSNLIELIETDCLTNDLFISEKKYEELLGKSLVPTAGDILITSRGTLGKCYIVKTNDKFYFQDGMISWLSNLDKAITPIFLTYLFDSRYIKKQIDSFQAGSTVAYLSIAMLKKINIVVPPIDLQNQFADFVTQVENQKAIVQQSIDKLETLKKSLMQEYFG